MNKCFTYIVSAVIGLIILYSCQENNVKQQIAKREKKELQIEINHYMKQLQFLEADVAGVDMSYVFGTLEYETGPTYDPNKKNPFTAGTYRHMHLSRIKKVYPFEKVSDEHFLDSLDTEIKKVKGVFLKSATNHRLHRYTSFVEAYAAKTKIIDAYEK